MSSMPYVLVVLFTIGDGSVVAMKTWQSFASPLTCSMQAFMETESAKQRTYICVTREQASALLGKGVEVSQPSPIPQGARTSESLQ
ncbi:MAG: hypothetical protein AAF495_28930 [Pseudomonadota bacterium]